MASTTLMTFLLYTPSTVRSVELLGSWDNFNRAYPMKQDKRIGAGHWRGCHTFTDIVCDGTTDGWSPGRNGGLKMGGTYWYYYRLDGDVESYNETEPITTLCPLLPGQPVNILHVPIVLPDSNSQHKRDGSISSQKSEIRTMDPQDKYMNPRTPPRPKPPRLKTSPPLYQEANCSWSSLLSSPLNVHGDRSVSQPVSATDNPKCCIAPKLKAARSVSPPKSRGLRAAFKHLAAVQPPNVAPEERHRGRPVARTDEIGHLAARSGSPHDDRCNYVDASNASSDYSSRVTSPEDSDIEGLGIERLPFRRPAMEKDSSPPAPIWSRRASKLGRRDPSPISHCLRLDGPSQEIKFSSPSASNTKVLEPLEEVLSQQDTPLAIGATVSDGDPTSIPVNHVEKRLPTLPNSPSSVMDEELRAMDAMNRVLDTKVLCSHFSDCTSTDDSATLAGSTNERSRFSEWSTDTELVSPASMTSSSTLNNDSQGCSPSSDVIAGPHFSSPLFHPSSSGPATPTLNPIAGSFSPVTVAHQSPVLPSSARTSFRTSDDEEDLGDVESNSKRHAAMFPGLTGIDHYSFFPTGSPMARPTSHQNDSTLNTPVPARKKDLDSEQFDSGVVFHSRAMRELIDELSYLGEMIQAGT
ncbi:hypothetical protein V8E54_004785 [Elaphomyces granulatus]